MLCSLLHIAGVFTTPVLFKCLKDPPSGPPLKGTADFEAHLHLMPLQEIAREHLLLLLALDLLGLFFLITKITH